MGNTPKGVAGKWKEKKNRKFLIGLGFFKKQAPTLVSLISETVESIRVGLPPSGHVQFRRLV
jgi:hypothetical protein